MLESAPHSKGNGLSLRGGRRARQRRLRDREDRKLDTQDADGSSQAPHTDQHEPDSGGLPVRHSARSRLLRISDVERESAPTSPLRCVLEWMRGFLAQPHPRLGRKGSVCPFVPIALELDTIWMTEVAEDVPSLERISASIIEYRDVFLATEPTSGPEAINKAFLVTFPSLSHLGPEGTAIIDTVQASLKKYFVDMGLMLGEFHPANDSPGLRNPDFRPLRSPIPMLAIRHMVESDLPFLVRERYPPKVRVSFLRSYLFRLGGNLSPPRFNEALESLISAEIAIVIARSTDGETTVLTPMIQVLANASAELVSTAR
jgi:hypothetical protein